MTHDLHDPKGQLIASSSLSSMPPPSRVCVKETFRAEPLSPTGVTVVTPRATRPASVVHILQ
jgi:hypothetical protein